MGQGVFSEGGLQVELGQIMLFCRDITGLAVASEEVETQRTAKVEVQRLQDVYLHLTNVARRARPISDVDEVFCN